MTAKRKYSRAQVVEDVSLRRPKRTRRRMDKPFACTLCNYRATQKGNLTRHMRTHTGQKPFACTLCDYRAAVKSHLTAHMRTHTGQKPFACTMCDYRAADKSTLTTHMRTHTGQKPFACTLCDYRAAVKSHLTRHMKSHTRNESHNTNMAAKIAKFVPAHFSEYRDAIASPYFSRLSTDRYV